MKDYDNLVGLVSIIQNVFKTLTKKVEKKISHLKLAANDNNSSVRSYRPEEEYEKLEQIIQKHEAEIRNHISVRLLAPKIVGAADEIVHGEPAVENGRPRALAEGPGREPAETDPGRDAGDVSNSRRRWDG